jgi:hypothetical protein
VSEGHKKASVKRYLKNDVAMSKWLKNGYERTIWRRFDRPSFFHCRPCSRLAGASLCLAGSSFDVVRNQLFLKALLARSKTRSERYTHAVHQT